MQRLPTTKKNHRSNMRQIESKIQQICVEWFRFQYPKLAKLLFAVPNGGYRNQSTASHMKAEGVVAGVADLILLIPSQGFHALCIEMKTEKGRQSDKQKIWQQLVESHGYKYVICHSSQSFFVEVQKYLQKSL